MGHHQFQVPADTDRSRWDGSGPMRPGVRWPYCVPLACHCGGHIVFPSHVAAILCAPRRPYCVPLACGGHIVCPFTGCWSPCRDSTLISASADHCIKIWNLDTCEIMSTLVAHDNPVCTLTLKGDRLFSGSLKSIKVWCGRVWPCGVGGCGVGGCGQRGNSYL